jgi:hypothetical protein
VQDCPGPEEGDCFDTTAAAPGLDATLRFATALVQDGMSGVTVVVPRAPGVLTRARVAAQLAGVRVRAHDVGSASITMRFSLPADAVPVLRKRAPRSDQERQRWRRLLGWLAG